MADGSLIFDTTLDSSGFKKGLSGISSMAGGLASAAGKGLAVIGAATSAAAAATGALVKSAVEGYADYEQLTGGVETLFKDSSSTIMQYANDAYKTAGLSANEYMSTITGFSASLLQGLGGDTEKAAQIGNEAVTDMADNANKMGTSIGDIQNAYQGFAKQNYTMLDNLKLGYGGTKEEMQRLLADAESLTGVHYDIGNFSDVIEAIHAVQTDLNISGLTAEQAAEAVANGTMTEAEAFEALGTTAKEASTTISGSLSMTKSAWTNLLAGMADDNADLDALITNFVESAGIAAENLLPRIGIALEGVGQLIAELFPIIIAQIPTIINDILPGLLESGANIVMTLFQGIESNFPTILQAAMDIIGQLCMMLVTMLPSILSMGAELLTTLLSGIQENLPTIVETVLLVITQICTSIIEMLPQILEMGIQLLVELALGIAQELPNLIPTIIDVMLTIVSTLLDNIDLLLDAAFQLILGLAEGLINSLPVLIEKMPQILEKIVSTLISLAPKLGVAALKLILTLAEGLINCLPQLVKNIPKILVAIENGLEAGFSTVADIGRNLILGLWNGIGDKVEWIKGKIKGFGEDVLSAIKGIFGIHSPSRKFKWIGQMCVEGFEEPLEDYNPYDTLNKSMKANVGTLTANFMANRGYGTSTTTNSTSQTFNIYQPVKTPSEMMRAARLEEQFGLAGA